MNQNSNLGLVNLTNTSTDTLPEYGPAEVQKMNGAITIKP